MNRPKSFYERREWLDLRYRVLKKYSATCMLCNRSRSDGVQIHVDHIYPISIYPERAFDEKNLQVLCHDCNLGKSNKFIDDYRYATPETQAQFESRREWTVEEFRQHVFERFEKMGLSEIELARLKKYASALPDMKEGA